MLSRTKTSPCCLKHSSSCSESVLEKHVSNRKLSLALFWLKNRSWDRGHNFSYKIYLEKLKDFFVNQSVLKKNLSWFFETPFLPSRIFLWKTGVKQRNMPVENLHLQQFRSASLIINSSHLRTNLKKLKEVFVVWYVRNKSLFQFSKLSFQLLRTPSGNLLVNAENRVFSAETGC